MIINKLNPAEDYNYWLKSLNTASLKQKIREHKVFKPTNVLRDTNIIYSPMSPPSYFKIF